LLGLRARDGLQRRLVALLVPDFSVVTRLGGRARAQDDAIQDQLPDETLILDHARVRQELVEINPHAPGVGGVGCAEVNEEHADMRRPSCRRSLRALDGNGRAHGGVDSRKGTVLVKLTGPSIVSAQSRGDGRMTVAEYCIFGSVALYLLTIVPIKWIGFRQYDNAKPRDPAFYQDAIRARALGAHQNGIEAFPFFAAAVLLAEFRAAPQNRID